MIGLAWTARVCGGERCVCLVDGVDGHRCGEQSGLMGISGVVSGDVLDAPQAVSEGIRMNEKLCGSGFPIGAVL